MRFSPHFQLFYFNDRLEICEFFEWKIKRINNADLFSQPPLLIFTKGANISGGHCILYVYMCVYIYIYIYFTVNNMHLSVWKNYIQFATMLVTKQVHIEFHCILFFARIMEVSGYCQPFGYQQFFKISSFVFNRRKKLTFLEQHVGE